MLFCAHDSEGFFYNSTQRLLCSQGAFESFSSRMEIVWLISAMKILVSNIDFSEDK